MNKDQLIELIESQIYANNNGAITGPILQNILKKIVEYATENGGNGVEGKDGIGIDNILSTRFSEGSKTGVKVQIKLTNNDTVTLPKIYDGTDGVDGAQGPRGYSGRDGMNGSDGADGRDGRDGEDGRDGKDGKDGKDGFQGRQGAAVRGPYDFYSMSGTTRWWCNGEESEDYPDSQLWIDVILKDDVYYYCNTTYYGRLSPWNNVKSRWTAGESFEFIATKLLLARNAKINFLTGNEIYLMDSNGHITGGAAGGNGVNFWAGAEHPSSGKFRVYADGRVVATDAQIKGAITATSLTLRGSNIDDYINNVVDDAMNGFNPDDAIDERQVNDIIRNYLIDMGYVKSSDLRDYFTEDKLREWFRNNYSAMTEEQIEEIVRRMVSAETSSVNIERMPDGSLKHTAYIDNREYVWYTYDAGKYMLIDTEVSGWSGNRQTRFVVDRKGLLTAENAFVSGKIYASEGWFKGRLESQEGFFRGSVSADNGYFHGDIVANSLMLGSQSIQDYVSGKVSAATGNEGITTDDVNRLIDQALSGQNWVVMEDLGDYLKLGVKLGGSLSSVTISKQGLLVAKNAIVSGTVFANDGIFNGTVHANDGYFHGDVVARSLTLGDNQSFEDFVNGKIASAITSGMDEATIAEIINQHIGSGGNWVVLEDLGDSLGLGVRYGNGLSSITISKQGLLVAKNAIVSGTVFANDGIFNGTVYANDGYFNGAVSATSLYLGRNAVVSGTVYANKGRFTNISADNITIKNSSFSGDVYARNGYFKGTISADTGYIGDLHFLNATGKSLSLYINDVVNDKVASAMTEDIDPDMVSAIISAYINESGFTDYVKKDDYHAFSGFVAGWMAAHSASGITWGSISGFAEDLIHSELSEVLDVSVNPDGSLKHRVVIGGVPYEWDTFKTEDYMLLGNWIGDSATTGPGGFLISREGLMEANNAVVYGKIYASEGYFKGNVSADSGYFKGKIEASSGNIGGIEITSEGLKGTNIDITNNYFFSDNVDIKGNISADNGYFRGELQAAKGSFSGVVTATTLYLGGQSVTGFPSTDGFLQLGNDYDNLTISTDGALVAQNAVISGTVCANNGYFKGRINATEGSFKGSISADTGYFSNGIKVGGPNGPTFEQYIGNHISSSNIVTTYRGQYDSGKTYYGNSERCDIVRYGASYYITRPNAPDSDFSNIPPTDDEYWNFFDNSFENVATDYAFINNLVVSRLNTAGENGTSERIVAEGNELLMYDSANTMHLRIVGDEIDLSSPASSFRTSGKTENFYTHGNGQQDGHDEVWLNLVNIKLPQKAGTYTIQMPKFKLRSYHSPYYDSDFSDFYVKTYYKLSGTTNYIPVSERESWTAAGTEIGTYYFEADNITTTQITVGSQQDNTKYEFWAQVEFDWWGENTQVPGDTSWSLALEVTDITNSSVFVLGSDSNNIVTIGSNGLSVAIGTMSAIFGVQNGMAKIELRGNDSRGTDIGVRIDGVSGLTMSTGGTWMVPKIN